MQLGIFAKTFPGSDPRTVLSAASEAGYATVQYNMACSGLGSLPAEIPDAAIDAVREAVASTGVTIAALSATYNMIHPDHATREAGRAAFAALAAAAPALGTRLLTVCTGSRDATDQWRHHPDNATDEAWRDMRQEMALLIEIAERHDLSIGIEPELANVISSAPLARRLLDELQSSRLRIVLDPANLFEIGQPAERKRLVTEAIDLLGPAIALAHAKDRTEDGGFTTAGRGVIDFSHYLAALRAAGFDGALVTHGLIADEAPGVATYLAAALGRQ